MQVQKINYTYPNLNVASSTQTKPKTYSNYSLHTVTDTFIKSRPDSQITFNGNNRITEYIIKYLKNKSYENAMRGSRRPYLSLQPDLDKIITKVDIKVGKNESIKAYDINPKNSNKYIIFLHGFSQNITSNQPLYKALTDTDYGILAIDYRGYGKSLAKSLTTETEIMHDVQAAAKYLTDKGINTIGLVGHSFGSYIAAKTSNLNNFNFQILVSPMLSLEFWLKNVLKNPKKYKIESTLIKYIPGFKEQYYKIFDISKHIEQNTTPTYVIHSKTDGYIAAQGVTKFVNTIPNKKEYILLPRGGHRMDDNKINTIAEVLKKL